MDEQTSDYVADSWQKALRAQNIIKRCDELVPVAESKKTLQFLNLSHMLDSNANYLTMQQRQTLITEFKATHVVSLHYFYREPKQLRVVASLYALNPYAKDKMPELAKPLQISNVSEAYFHQSTKTWLLLFLSSLLPNTASLGFSNENFANSLTDPTNANQRYVELSKNENSSLPPIINSFRVDSILHRNGFNKWDAGYSILPSSTWTYLDNSYQLADKTAYDKFQRDPMQPKYQAIDYRIKFYSYATSLNIEGDLYTPFGSIFITYGLGPAFYYYMDNMDNHLQGIAVSSLETIGYRAFINDRWYVQFVIENQLYQNTVKNTYFYSTMDTYATLSIGYFYPEFRQFVSAHVGG